MKTTLFLTCALCLLVQNIFGQEEYQRIHPKQRHHELRNPRDLSEPIDIHNQHKFKVGDRDIQINTPKGQNPNEQQFKVVKNVITEDFLVNDDVTGVSDQMYASVAMDGSGNIVIVWMDERNGNFDIYYQRYNSNGIAQGVNTKVNDVAGTVRPSISIDGSGNFVIVWVDYRNGNSDIYYQRYNSVGTAQGVNTKANDDTGNAVQGYPSISMDGSSNFVIVWDDYRNGDLDIYYQRYNSIGTAQGVNTKTNDDAGSRDQQLPSISVDGSGNFVIVWEDRRNGNGQIDIYYQRYNSIGTAQGVNIKANDDAGTAYQRWPSISMDGSGNFVIVWHDERNGSDIYYQRYNSIGTAQGVNTKVNDDAGTQYYPSIAMDGGGNFVIVWQDYRYGINNPPDIIGQRYFSNGNANGSNYSIVADGPNHGEVDPVVAANNNKIIFSWMDDRRSKGWDIYGKIVGWDWNGVVPVELTSFEAAVTGIAVQLNWATATERNNRGFQIERKTENPEWKIIGFREGKGTTTIPQEYSFIDNLNEVNVTTFSYRLKQIDFNGTFEYSNVIEVEINTPLKFELSQNYPNPFNPSTKIKYTIPTLTSFLSQRERMSEGQVRVTLKVYDILGKEIVTLVDEYKPTGSYEVEFQSSAGNKQLASGIYFYQLKAGEFVETKKMILLR